MTESQTSLLRRFYSWLKFFSEMGAGIPVTPAAVEEFKKTLNRPPGQEAVTLSQAPSRAAPSRAAAILSGPGPAVSGPQDPLGALKKKIASCRSCSLAPGISSPLFGQGPLPSRIMIVGDGPTLVDSERGLPFQGEAGELLTKMLRAVNIERRQVFVTNAIKCRSARGIPPDRKNFHACRKHLLEQIGMASPEIILCLGDEAAAVCLDVDMPVKELRGKVHDLSECNTRVIVTHAPAFLLRLRGNIQKKYKLEAWKDLQMIEAICPQAASSRELRDG